MCSISRMMRLFIGLPAPDTCVNPRKNHPVHLKFLANVGRGSLVQFRLLVRDRCGHNGRCDAD